MRLTSHLNLSALVTCHTLYVVFTTLQSAVFLLNSRQTQFTVACRSRHPFSRSYGAILPSSLERFLSRALVYSTHPPVSVCGTGGWENNCGLFSATRPLIRFGQRPRLSIQSDSQLSCCTSTALTPTGAGIFNLLCIHYALRPRVSSRLTLGGRTWPRKPWVYGDRDSHPVYRYSCLHSH